jgi:uncharacterized protein with FMN-binding domain
VKRGPIVIAGTVAGLVAVLEFHTTPAKVTFAGSSTLPAASTGGTGSSGTGSSGTGASGTGASGTGASGSGTGGQPASSGSTSGTRTATGPDATGPEVNYSWGVLAVKITVSGGKITRVGLAYLDDGGNPRSQSIDQQAIPVLEQQALQAQSANIQGVSGASYTTAGFDQSLQSALHSLGM